MERILVSLDCSELQMDVRTTMIRTHALNRGGNTVNSLGGRKRYVLCGSHTDIVQSRKGM